METVTIWLSTLTEPRPVVFRKDHFLRAIEIGTPEDFHYVNKRDWCQTSPDSPVNNFAVFDELVKIMQQLEYREKVKEIVND